jgi:hypothetical protein
MDFSCQDRCGGLGGGSPWVWILIFLCLFNCCNTATHHPCQVKPASPPDDPEPLDADTKITEIANQILGEEE